MRIGLIGKGGSGKTTLAAALALHAAAPTTKAKAGNTVLAIDADINQTLGTLLGFENTALLAQPALGSAGDALRAHIFGNSKRISRPQAIIKTTLPTPGGNLVQLQKTDPVLRNYGLWRNKLCLLQVGGFNEADIGVACYHSKTGAVELLLNHLPDTRDDLVITDFSAGADLFASGLFTRFDALLLVTEPTLQSAQVARQIMNYAAPYGVAIRIAAHKIQSADDTAFLNRKLGQAPQYTLPHETAMAVMARTGTLAPAQLSAAYQQTLTEILTDLHSCPRNASQYWADAASWHRRNAAAWANKASGEQLEEQLDEEFLSSLGFPA